MRIVCVGYRDWATTIYHKLVLEFPDYEFILQLNEDDFCETTIVKFQPDLVLFYGWSQIIPERLVTTYSCLMLHPSPLPKYRGGSPIQNQIIRGETNSAVTIFLMDKGIDTGPIAKQKEIDLTGSLDEVFERISTTGFELTCKILCEGLSVYAQDEREATFFSRRKSCESEITLDELTNQSSVYLYNKIRMLQDPYPNAFFKTSDGKRIVLKHVSIEDVETKL